MRPTARCRFDGPGRHVERVGPLWRGRERQAAIEDALVAAEPGHRVPRRVLVTTPTSTQATQVAQCALGLDHQLLRRRLGNKRIGCRVSGLGLASGRCRADLTLRMLRGDDGSSFGQAVATAIDGEQAASSSSPSCSTTRWMPVGCRQDQVRSAGRNFISETTGKAATRSCSAVTSTRARTPTRSAS